MQPPTAIILIGIQAAGKSSYVREQFFDTHVRINLDMLRTRPREARLLAACLAGRISFVVDNTNVTRESRQRYIPAARAAGFRVVGYFFESKIGDALARNARRERQVPVQAVSHTSNRLELPSLTEGFDELYFVRLENGGFIVEPWRHEV